MTCGKKTKHGSRIGCCALCKELFSGDTAFERHFTNRGDDGRRRCQPPADAGLIAKPSKTAPGETVWSMPGSSPWTKDHGPALTVDGFSRALTTLRRDGGDQ